MQEKIGIANTNWPTMKIGFVIKVSIEGNNVKRLVEYANPTNAKICGMITNA